jgi:hypothetical protein
MLAYVFWHRPAAGVAVADYERALVRFHGGLAHNPPSGFRGSAALRAAELPWLADEDPIGGAGYEDWYLVDGWDALGVLESAAVSRGHASAHDAAARRTATGTGAVYRQIEGGIDPLQARLAVWVSRPAGHADPTVAQLLEDGIGPDLGSLWRRSLVLGPAPEFCLLLSMPSVEPETGVAQTRLPAGWSARAAAREALVA